MQPDKRFPNLPVDFGHPSGYPATTPAVLRLIQSGQPVTLEAYAETQFPPDEVPTGVDLQAWAAQVDLPWELDPLAEGPDEEALERVAFSKRQYRMANRHLGSTS